MKTLKEKIEVMQAALDGRSVETKIAESDYSWGASNTQPPVFNWHINDYRIKPEPREYYLSFWGHDGVTVSKTMAAAPAGRETIKVREVLDA